MVILKCIGHSGLRDDHNDILVPEAAAAASNGDGVVHQRDEIKNKEKARYISFSCCWQRIIVKWKRESRRNKDLGKPLENVSNDDSQLDELQGKYRKEASFNLGVGFGLVYHSVAFRDELNKMIELRGQMQHILQNVENALATKMMDSISPTKKVSHHLDVSSSSNQGAESRTTFVCDNYHDCETTTQERLSEGMDQLEEELEAELEQLQLHLDTEIILKHKEEGRFQMNVLETGGGLCQSGRRYKEVVIDDPQTEEEVEHNGVSPTELERKLHELLESRQEERIKELEAALERAKRKLSEKEREVSWWKNTASIISKHVPEPSFLHK